AHRRVCDWLDRRLSRVGAKPHDSKKPMDDPVREAAPPNNHQLDFEVRTKAQVFKAKCAEAALLHEYRRWLTRQQRTAATIKYGGLQCDAFEEERKNLIEAKSSTRREQIRMAVGQLLDYAFKGRSRYHDLHMAILLPEKPPPDVEDWLLDLEIKLVWREG